MDQHGMGKKYRSDTQSCVFCTWEGEEAKQKPIGRACFKTIMVRIQLQITETTVARLCREGFHNWYLATAKSFRRA